jgi:hypothetical protein
VDWLSKEYDGTVELRYNRTLSTEEVSTPAEPPPTYEMIVVEPLSGLKVNVTIRMTPYGEPATFFDGINSPDAKNGLNAGKLNERLVT